MHLAERVKTYLERMGVPYVLMPHAPSRSLGEAAELTHADARQLARAVLLQDAQGLLLAIVPADHLLDFHALREHCGRDCRPASPEQISAVFDDCLPGSVPPVPEPYGLAAVVDDRLTAWEHIHFEAGSRRSLVSVHSSGFQRLHQSSRRAPIARPLDTLESRDPQDFLLPGALGRKHALGDLRPVEDIRRAIEQVERLPAMPEMAQRLLRLLNDPRATLDDLTGTIQYDPSLTAQILRYARSAFLGYRGKIDTLQQAVTRVLGFDTALAMALGLATSRSFRNPADGPLGLQAFWRHAAYSAALAQALASVIGPRLPLKPGLAYLAGLLHNFGFLLAGHLFRAEFFLLNRVVAANPQVPVTLIERHVLGVEHTQIGAWLMANWNMPEAVTVSCREHHNAAYVGREAEYAQLMQCVDHLLRAHGIGEGGESEPPGAILTALGLNLDDAHAITARLLESAPALDAMARQLAA